MFALFPIFFVTDLFLRSWSAGDYTTTDCIHAYMQQLEEDAAQFTWTACYGWFDTFYCCCGSGSQTGVSIAICLGVCIVVLIVFTCWTILCHWKNCLLARSISWLDSLHFYICPRVHMCLHVFSCWLILLALMLAPLLPTEFRCGAINSM